MKTPLFFLAALVAFFALPVDFITAISVLFIAGLAAIAFSDYRQKIRLSGDATVHRLGVGTYESFQLAA